jgi:hypothetical protein
MCKFVVVKGRNVIVGKAGCEYSIFDKVEFSDVLHQNGLENEMRKYVYRKLYEIDNKKAKDIKKNTWCRNRHILKYDGSVLIESIKVFDYFDGTFYGFIPVQDLI